MSDTFFTTSPNWALYIIPYFFVGGIAGGVFFLAALLEWFGEPHDRPVIRIAYYVAFIGAILSGVLLTIDLGRPLRFWHMLFESHRLPAPMFKPWSPMSFGAWILALFGLVAMLAAIGAWSEAGRLQRPALHLLHTPIAGKILSLVGGVLGFFLAGYTGVLLSVTNRPIWADSNLVGLLFLLSGASCAAATLILLAERQGGFRSTVGWLARFDAAALVLEAIALVAFVISLGSVARVWISPWGLLLLIGVVGLGILIPLALHWRPGRFSRWAARPLVTGAVLVLVGGFLLRVVILIASDVIGPQRFTRG